MSDPNPTPAAPTPAPHDAHAPGHGHDEGHISDRTFVYVFIGLMIFTVVSFTTNLLLRGSPVINFLIILAVACVKAALVMTYFMHLKIDWRKVFVFLIPICILAPMVIMVLWPDLVLAWRLATPE